ncbi:hypothetical protein [Streptomyces cyanogenus]|uniref:Secreted protein n=1 Tax=Streptomyces cyanogenus TaxID=80860 RepID=A0ABX7TST6_STRCY|nr:hypothetical protein [Streptomyces cyanogenus]QTD99805.1 hypothetical protein S1361_20885 [Streptomyces cyanogenus]
MGKRGRHAAPSATAGRIRRAAAVVLTTGALVSGGHSAFAAGGAVAGGAETIDQDGQQNLACGNSARLVNVNVGGTVHREQVCVDDGRTRRHSASADGARAVGGTTLGPQTNIAQSGRQNLYCGNSADLVTVNALGTMSSDTTCVATDHGDSRRRDGGHPEHTGGARARGGTTFGPQVNAAQSGRQNLYCGNSSGTLTVNAAGTIRDTTTCAATDHSSSRHGVTHYGRASADAGEVVGFETDTAQNGRQNQTCGTPGTGVEIPLGRADHKVYCTAEKAAP